MKVSALTTRPVSRRKLKSKFGCGTNVVMGCFLESIWKEMTIEVKTKVFRVRLAI